MSGVVSYFMRALSQQSVNHLGSAYIEVGKGLFQSFMKLPTIQGGGKVTKEVVVESRKET